MKNSKGQKISRWGFVTAKGTAIVGCMAWETPYIYFSFGDAADVIRWHSDNAAVAFDALECGQTVHIDGFLYGDHLRRVTVKTETGQIFGGKKRL